MDHSIRENIYDELNIFVKKKPTEISSVLEEYLALIGKTGDIIFPWAKLKPLFKYKLDRVIQKFYEDYPAKDLPYSPNMEKFNFDIMHAKLLNAVEEFTGAPFTIQRLCELVVCPDKHYKRVDKFMRALEKDLLVVSTIEPVSKRQRTDSETSSLVNGVTETTSSLNGSAQSPQSTHSNEETNVESTAESIDQNVEETSSFTNDEEKFDCESEAEADGKEVVKEESEQCSATTDMMETTVTSSSMAEANESQDIDSPQHQKPKDEMNHEDIKSVDEDTDKVCPFEPPSLLQEKTEALPMEAHTDAKSEDAKKDGRSSEDEQMVVESGPHSDLCADPMVSDSSSAQLAASCSDDEPCNGPTTTEEKEAEVKIEESSCLDAGSSVVNNSPESSAATIPDSPSHSLEVEASNSVSEMSAPDSLSTESVSETENVLSSALASDDVDQPRSPPVSTTTTHFTDVTLTSTSDTDLLQQPQPEPMEDD